MNFHRRIKEQLADTRNRAGRDRVAVDAYSLKLLIDDYEILGEKCRVSYFDSDSNYQHFKRAVKLLYFENRDNFGDIFLQVSEILKPLIEEDFKRSTVINLKRYEK